MERKIAKEFDESTYVTGRPCKHGHVTYRYTSSGACAGCVAAARDKPEVVAQRKKDERDAKIKRALDIRQKYETEKNLRENLSYYEGWTYSYPTDEKMIVSAVELQWMLELPGTPIEAVRPVVIRKSNVAPGVLRLALKLPSDKEAKTINEMGFALVNSKSVRPDPPDFSMFDEAPKLRRADPT